MKNLNELQKELDEINSKLDKICKERDLLDKQILALVAKRDKAVDSISTIKLSSIPISTPEKMTESQWEWLLQASDNVGQVRYKARNSVIESFGFYAFGYDKGTNQPVLSISKYKIDKVKEGFKIIAPHLKAVTVTDRTTETGIRLEVTDLEENMTSVLYVHKNKKCTLYITRYRTEKFGSFDEFIDWYKIKASN